VPELPEVEALAADLRERAAGRVIDQAFIAEFSVLKTYDPPLTALHGATVSGTSWTWRPARRRRARPCIW